MNITTDPTPIAHGLAFGEAPRWHAGKLWYSDFYTHKVMCIDTDGHAIEIADVPGQPSGLGWLPDGRMLVVSMTDRRLLRQDEDGLTTVADLASLAPFHCNDMVVDRHGRAYIGNFGFDLAAKEEVKSTVLILVTPDGQATVAADELLFPNGCVITPDGATMVIAETFGKRLTAFDIAADGTLSRRRVWAELGDATPDGICLDAEGAIWVASPMTREFIRVVEGGEITDRIAVKNQAIACVLGGEDGRTLFMITGHVGGGSHTALEHRSGRIDALQVDVPGAGLR